MCRSLFLKTLLSRSRLFCRVARDAWKALGVLVMLERTSDLAFVRVACAKPLCFKCVAFTAGADLHVELLTFL